MKTELREAGDQRDAALGDKLELEAKIAAAADERRSLLERCLEVRREEKAQCGIISHVINVFSLLPFFYHRSG